MKRAIIAAMALVMASVLVARVYGACTLDLSGEEWDLSDPDYPM